MKLFPALLLLTIAFSCSDPGHRKDHKELVTNAQEDDTGWNYQKVERWQLDSWMIDICSTQDLEVIDLYPIIDSIASDSFENLVLVDSLRAKGFSVTGWGRGNWAEGPRIVSITLSNKQCQCQVDKLYYSTERKNSYKVTERLKCKKRK